MFLPTTAVGSEIAARSFLWSSVSVSCSFCIALTVLSGVLSFFMSETPVVRVPVWTSTPTTAGLLWRKT